MTTKPDELRDARAAAPTSRSYADTPTGRLLVLPVNGQVPAANVGDVLSGATTGPVDWSTVRRLRHRGHHARQLRRTTTCSRPSATPQAADQLAVATYNVENLAPADPQSKFDRLAAGVVTNLASRPTSSRVEEIQDNNGATDDGGRRRRPDPRPS